MQGCINLSLLKSMGLDCSYSAWDYTVCIQCPTRSVPRKKIFHRHAPPPTVITPHPIFCLALSFCDLDMHTLFICSEIYSAYSLTQLDFICNIFRAENPTGVRDTHNERPPCYEMCLQKRIQHCITFHKPAKLELAAKET